MKNTMSGGHDAHDMVLQRIVQEVPKISGALKNFVAICAAQLSVATETTKKSAITEEIPSTPARVLLLAKLIAKQVNVDVVHLLEPLKFEALKPQGKEQGALERLEEIAKIKVWYVILKRLLDAKASPSKYLGKSLLIFLLSVPHLRFKERVYESASDERTKRQLAWFLDRFVGENAAATTTRTNSESLGRVAGNEFFSREYVRLIWSRNFKAELREIQRKNQEVRRKTAQKSIREDVRSAMGGLG